MLEGKGMLENSVIIFTTDNGGPANGFNFNWANNYPLRGVKASLYEGTKIRLCHSPSFTSGWCMYQVFNMYLSSTAYCQQ